MNRLKDEFILIVDMLLENAVLEVIIYYNALGVTFEIILEVLVVHERGV